MKINGRLMDTEASRMAAIWESATLSQDDVSAIAHVQFYDVFMTYEGEDKQCRPVLTMLGRISHLNGEFPENISEVDFGEVEALQPEIYCRYVFNDSEVIQLIERGFYEPEFKIPEIFTEEDVLVEIPVQCDCNILPPKYEEDVPVLFVRIRDALEIETSEEHCHYRFADMFPVLDRLALAQERAKAYQESKELDWDLDKALDLNLETKPVEDEKKSLDHEVEIPETPEGNVIKRAYENIESRVDEKLVDTSEVEVVETDVPEADIFEFDEDEFDLAIDFSETDASEISNDKDDEELIQVGDDGFIDFDEAFVETDVPEASVRGLGSLERLVEDLEDQKEQQEKNRQSGLDI